MDSMIYILRTCSLYFPSFLKLVVSLRKGRNQDKILELLATRTIIEIKDKEIFESEGKSYLEFALSYTSSSASKNPPIQSQEMGGGDSSTHIIRTSSQLSNSHIQDLSSVEFCISKC
jgi:hypothetical protein